MKNLQLFGRLTCVFSLLLLTLFQLTKDKIRWPAFIANNIFYICIAFIAIGYVLLYTHYTRTKNPKKANELIIFAIVIVAFFGFVKLVSK